MRLMSPPGTLTEAERSQLVVVHPIRDNPWQALEVTSWAAKNNIPLANQPDAPSVTQTCGAAQMGIQTLCWLRARQMVVQMHGRLS